MSVYLAVAQTLDLEAQRDMLLTIITWLILLTLGLALYISQAPPYEWKGWHWSRPSHKEQPHCPFHRCPPTECVEKHRDQ